MPILVKDYTWTQATNTLHIRIPISPSQQNDVDLFTTDAYIKAHFRPFLFEVFLLHDIENEKSKCLVKEDMIVLDLMKKEDLEWDRLEKDLTKEEKKTIRQEILEKCQEEAKNASEERRIKKSQMDRFTVQQAMDIDSKQHSIMDSRRNMERDKAMNALEDWRSTAENGSIQVNNYSNPRTFPQNFVPKRNESSVKIVELSSSEDEDTKVVKKPAFKPIEPKQAAKKLVQSEYITKKKVEMAQRVLPSLRQSGQVEISHTPRVFPTPSRESAAAEEEAWLKNISLARRATGFMHEDLRPEEQDPQWCKEKGDEFFKAGNFLGAISAYTHGITLSDKLPSLFSNRAATHFALGNFNKCMADCSTALDLMKPECEGNRRSRAKCIARRAAALARAGYLNKAIGEMKAAAKLLPDDEKIKKDIYDMERAWEQNPDSD